MRIRWTEEAERNLDDMEAYISRGKLGGVPKPLVIEKTNSRKLTDTLIFDPTCRAAEAINSLACDSFRFVS